MLISILHQYVHGDVFRVKPNADPTNVLSGGSWVNATNLQRALSLASSGDEIWVHEGIYYPDQGQGQTTGSRFASFSLKGGVSVYGGFSGAEIQRNQRDPEAYFTILSGDIDHATSPDITDSKGVVVSDPKNNIKGFNSIHVVTVNVSSDMSILDGFIITSGGDGSGRGTGAINYSDNFTMSKCQLIGNLAENGSAFYSFGNSTLSDCSFSNNFAYKQGGAVMLKGNGPSHLSRLSNCAFTGNVSDREGGAIHVENSSPSLSGCTFTSNSSGSGGAISLSSPVTATTPSITNCNFTGNSSSLGGAIYNNKTNTRIKDSIFEQNTSSTVGGAISNRAFSNPELTNCVFQGNTADDNGGAVHHDISDSIFVKCSFLNNTATTSGGAVYTHESKLTIKECSFQGNTAERGNGGSVFIDHASSVLSVETSFFFGNRSDNFGGALYVDQTPASIFNCIFVGNTSDYGGAMALQNVSSLLSNSTVTQNVALLDGGGLHASNGSHTAKNNIIWNNLASSSSLTTSASVFIDTITPNYSHCIIANSGGSSAWTSTLGTDGGNNLDVDPMFAELPDSGDGDWRSLADNKYGNLRLLTGSQAINSGNNSGVTSLVDIDGEIRIQDMTIDLGAYEGSFTTFAQSHPLLAPSEDANGNGVSNFDEYARGFDPSLMPNPNLRPRVSNIGGNLSYVYTRRSNSADAVVEWKQSTNMKDWSAFNKGDDYTVTAVSAQGANRDLITIKLLADPTSVPKLFIVQRYKKRDS